MPLIRCRHYAEDGTGQCPRIGVCEYVHPSEPKWAVARPAPGRAKVQRRCRSYAQNGSPINGGCHNTHCSFLHPTSNGWASASTARNHDSLGSITIRGAARNRESGDPTRPTDKAKRNASNDSSWGSHFGGGSADTIRNSRWGTSAEDGGGGNLAETGGWGSSTGWASVSNNAGQSVTSEESKREEWGSSTARGGVASASNDPSHSLSSEESPKLGKWASAVNKPGASVPSKEDAETSRWAPSGATTYGDWNPTGTGGWGGVGDTTSGVSVGAGGAASTATGGWGSDSVRNSGEFSATSEAGGWTNGRGWGSNDNSSDNKDGRWKAVASVSSEKKQRSSREIFVTTDTSKTSSGKEGPGWLNVRDQVPDIAGDELRSTTTDGVEVNKGKVPKTESVNSKGSAGLAKLTIPSFTKTNRNEVGSSTFSQSASDFSKSPNSYRLNDDSVSSGCPSGAVTTLRGFRSASLSSVMYSPSLSLVDSSHSNVAALSDIKTPFIQAPKTQDEKKLLIQTTVSMLSQAVEARARLRDIDFQRQRWKFNMGSERYAHVSRAGRMKLEEIRDDLDNKARHLNQKLSSLTTSLAELPAFLYDGRLDLGVDAELKDLETQLKELRDYWSENTRSALQATGDTSNSLSMKRRQASTDNSPDEQGASSKHRIDQLEERVDNLERLESPDVRIWDATWEKLQQKFDEFLVEQQLEDQATIKEELKKKAESLDDANRAVNGEMGKLANDLALVIERQTQIEFFINDCLADTANKNRVFNEMLVAAERTESELATIKLQADHLRVQVQQLVSNMHHRPLDFKEIETRMEELMDKISSQLKEEIIEALQKSQRTISIKLDEQHDKMAEAVWPRLQKTLTMTDLICDWFMKDNHNTLMA